MPHFIVSLVSSPLHTLLPTASLITRHTALQAMQCPSSICDQRNTSEVSCEESTFAIRTGDNIHAKEKRQTSWPRRKVRLHKNIVKDSASAKTLNSDRRRCQVQGLWAPMSFYLVRVNHVIQYGRSAACYITCLDVMRVHKCT